MHFDLNNRNSDSIPNDDHLVINTTHNHDLFNQIDKKYFRNKTNPKITKRTFSIEEDILLSEFVKIYGLKKWPLISKNMKLHNFNRSQRQCRDRYLHYLDPKLKLNEEWSSEDDNYLLEFVSKNGKKWKLLERFLPGRSEVALRNRYNLLSRKIAKNEKITEKLHRNLKQKENENLLLSECDDSFCFPFSDNIYESDFDDFFEYQ